MRPVGVDDDGICKLAAGESPARWPMTGAQPIAIMVAAHIAALSTLFGRHDATRPTTHHERVGQWTLSVTHDPFAGTTRCALAARAMVVDRGVVTFYFGDQARTFEALYKVDAGPAVSWRANAMVLASTGSLAMSEDLVNASGGRVPVPLSVLAGARSISIRISPKVRAREFSLADLPAALARAEAKGCEPEAFAVGVR